MDNFSSAFYVVLCSSFPGITFFMVFISPYVTQMWFSSLSAIQFIIFGSNFLITLTPLQRSKVKVIPQQTEVAQGVPGRLMPRIFLTFGTTRVVDRQP